MESVENIKHLWLHEAKAMDIAYAGQPDRLSWTWPLNVKIGAVIEKNESRAIWKHGIIFTFSTDLSPDTAVIVQRINSRYEEPWVAIRVTSSKKGNDGEYVIAGKFEL